jgi:hypothetical protein
MVAILVFNANHVLEMDGGVAMNKWRELLPECLQRCALGMGLLVGCGQQYGQTRVVNCPRVCNTEANDSEFQTHVSLFPGDAARLRCR